jgi:hypothetical protein
VKWRTHQEVPDVEGCHSFHLAAEHVLDRKHVIELIAAVVHGG